MKRYLLLFALVALALSCVVLSACGRSDPEDTTAPATNPTVVTTAPAQVTTTTAAVVTSPATTTTTAPVTSPVTSVVTSPVTTAVTTPVTTVVTTPVTTVTTAPAPTPAPVMTLTGATVTYDGEDHAAFVVGELPAGTTVLYSINGADAVASYELINVGTYEIIATVTLPDGYEAAPALNCTVVIETAVVDMSGVAFPMANGDVFDDTVKTFEVFELPAGVSVSYTYTLNGVAVAEMKAVGVYTVTATFTAAENYAINPEDATLETTFTIASAAIDMSGVAFPAEATVLFDGTVKTFEVIGLPANVSVSYTYKQNGEPVAEMKDAGVYIVTATFASTDPNYAITAAGSTMDAVFTIEAAAIDMTDVAFPTENSVKFDGTVKTFEVLNLPANVTVVYTYTLNGEQVGEMKAAGVYTVTAEFSTDDNHTIDVTTLVAEFTILEDGIDMSGVAFPADNTAVFNGEAKTFEVVNLPEGVSVSYTYKQNGAPVAEMKDAGVYTVTATFASDDPSYILTSTTLEGTFTISKAEINTDGVAFPADNTAVFNGEAKTFVVENLPAGVSVTYTYTLNGELVDEMKAAGVYTVTATFISDDPNYTPTSTTLEGTFTISKAEINTDGVAFPADNTAVFNGEAKTFVVENLPAGVSVTYTYTLNGELVDEMKAAGVYTVTANLSADDSNYYVSSATVTATFTITAKQINVAELGIGDLDDWNYTNHDSYDATAGAIKFVEGFSYEMTLTEDAEATLAAAGLVVSYKTYLISANGEEVEVEGPVTERGTYKTVVVLSAIENHEIEDPETEIALAKWGVYGEKWTPPAA